MPTICKKPRDRRRSRELDDDDRARTTRRERRRRETALPIIGDNGPVDPAPPTR